eukprot:COSAG01_NODE_70_length_28755_cov_34.709067_10_plen_51_part_00
MGAKEVCHATAAILASFNQHELNAWLISGRVTYVICNTSVVRVARQLRES